MTQTREFTIEMDDRDINEIGNILLSIESNEMTFAEEIFYDMLCQIQQQNYLREETKKQMLDAICGKDENKESAR